MRLVVCLWCGPVVMAGTARLAAGLTCLLLLVVVNVAETAVGLEVHHPLAPNNYSEVRLTCTDGFVPITGSVVFWRYETDISEPGVVSNLEHEMNSVSFTFNQQQEGTFSCGEHDGRKSTPVDLAGT